MDYTSLDFVWLGVAFVLVSISFLISVIAIKIYQEL